MAKLGFTKLALKPNQSIVEVKYNDMIIEVKQYLPVEDKINLITDIIELSHDNNNFSNPIKVKVYTLIGIIENYTNISFTEKQKENSTKLYDLIIGNGLKDIVFSKIPEAELNDLITNLTNIIESIYNYRTSVLGILDIMSQDYQNLDLDATEIQKKLADPQNMELLKGIMKKLG